MRKVIITCLFATVFYSNSMASDNSVSKSMQIEVSKTITQIVETEFYDVSRVDDFKNQLNNGSTLQHISSHETGQGTDFNKEISDALSILRDHHTMRFTRQESGFYELMDIFAYAVTDEDRARLFPGVNRPNYFGVGLVAEQIDGKHYISKVYDGFPAHAAGLKIGDELISMSGAQSMLYPTFAPEQKFSSVVVRREQDQAPETVQVPIIRIYPQDMFLQASLSSLKLIEQDGRKIGYIRLWSGSNGGIFKELKKQLFEGQLKDAEGLILDIRSKWGGANLSDADLFVSNLSSMKMSLRDGTVINHRAAWQKPIVALIDKGTRSGMEIFAYNLQKNGILLIGEKTAGALTAATAYLLPDDSFFMMAIGSTLVDGQNLDGIGVKPNIAVEPHLPYANGADNMVSSALREIKRLM